MTVMKHVIGVADVDNKKSTHTIDLLVYGDEKGYSAMAKTVGYPVGIAATMILEGIYISINHIHIFKSIR